MQKRAESLFTDFSTVFWAINLASKNIFCIMVYLLVDDVIFAGYFGIFFFFFRLCFKIC